MQILVRVFLCFMELSKKWLMWYKRGWNNAKYETFTWGCWCISKQGKQSSLQLEQSKLWRQQYSVEPKPIESSSWSCAHLFHYWKLPWLVGVWCCTTACFAFWRGEPYRGFRAKFSIFQKILRIWFGYSWWSWPKNAPPCPAQWHHTTQTARVTNSQTTKQPEVN